MRPEGLDTMSDTKTEIIRASNYDTTLDQYMTRVCLERTMGDVVKDLGTTNNTKQYTVNSMIFNAVFEWDVDLIRTIALRIDGTVPAEGDRESYANILGDAIEDVLSYPLNEQLNVHEYDSPVIAMAKALVYVATQPAGSNYAKRKERNLAAQMILERTGGRKVEPARPQLETVYVEPEWMTLPSGEKEEQDGGENQGADS